MQYELGKMLEQILSNQELILRKLYPELAEAEEQDKEPKSKKPKGKRRTV